MDEKNLIKILRNIATLLELKGENVFKSRAYSNAADMIENGEIDVFKAFQEDKLNEIKGFGKALQTKIADYFDNGRMAYYEKLSVEIPLTLLDILKVSGLGVKKVRQIYEQLGISTLEELEIACLKGKICQLKGFAEKTEEMILNGIDHRKAAKGRILQKQANDTANELLNKIRVLHEIKYADITGKMRRFTELITELHLLVAVENTDALHNLISGEIITKNENGAIQYQAQEFPVIIEPCKTEDYYWRLNETTGNKEYIEALYKLLIDKGYKVEQNGIYKDSKKLILHSEKEIYDLLNIQYVPPELRESRLAIQKAIEYKIPELIERTDLKGMLHVHTKWSDGRNSLLEMALKSKELGFSYMAVCDHSRAAAYANGLSIERVKAQFEEIDRLNSENIGIHILKGIESDILSDGSLDYPDEILSGFELIVASIHSSFKMSKEDMTKRLIKATKNPYTKILGHPTGRLLLVRKPYEIDVKAVIDAAADYGKIIEINANPYRLDLPWEDVLYAKEIGVKIAINPDSHRISTLDEVYYGIGVARKGWLEAKDVVNCLELEKFYKEMGKIHL